MCFYAWGDVCVVLERRQLKTGSILAMVNKVCPVFLLLSWTCTGVIMGWLNHASGHTSEPRAKSNLNGNHPNPLEVASEERAKQGADFSDFLCVLYFPYTALFCTKKNNADPLVSWFFPECRKSLGENFRKKPSFEIKNLTLFFFCLDTDRDGRHRKSA